MDCLAVKSYTQSQKLSITKLNEFLSTDSKTSLQTFMSSIFIKSIKGYVDKPLDTDQILGHHEVLRVCSVC